MGYPEQYTDTELNPPPAGMLDMDCRAGNHRGCVGPPGTRCDCSCHVRHPFLAALDGIGMGWLDAFADQGAEDIAGVVELAREDET